MSLKRKAVTALVPILLVAVPGIYIFTHPESFTPGQLKKFDLNGMLKEINEKTKTLGLLNKDIYNGLLQLDAQSGKTQTVSQELIEVNQGVRKQGTTLEEIRRVTGQQVTLSQNLNRLSKQLSTQMELISNSGQKQVDQAVDLKSVTTSTRSKLAEVLKQNDLLEQKLKQAADKAEKVNRSMP
ncbi:hypothetical protein [Thermoactinomyces sp. CICC 10523]|uniref:hypothetical protein n=1 Tax=Thermoactinomyces sp. CICC 10523 TaxID=2767428 RepID=UPI0018DCE17C|nr:hypothetical protein [Thermoactinomyces sp. CICC 10523]MBH8596565.1 hypothetical protein [Thermoactinomyces sp. CICC 10523]